jgi:hypothetical protein
MADSDTMSAAMGRMMVLRIAHQTGVPKPFARCCLADVRRLEISPTFVMDIPLSVLMPVSTPMGRKIFDRSERHFLAPGIALNRYLQLK